MHIGCANAYGTGKQPIRIWGVPYMWGLSYARMGKICIQDGTKLLKIFSNYFSNQHTSDGTFRAHPSLVLA